MCACLGANKSGTKSMSGARVAQDDFLPSTAFDLPELPTDHDRDWDSTRTETKELNQIDCNCDTH